MGLFKGFGVNSSTDLPYALGAPSRGDGGMEGGVSWRFTGADGGGSLSVSRR